MAEATAVVMPAWTEDAGGIVPGKPCHGVLVAMPDASQVDGSQILKIGPFLFARACTREEARAVAALCGAAAVASRQACAASRQLSRADLAWATARISAGAGHAAAPLPRASPRLAVGVAVATWVMPQPVGKPWRCFTGNAWEAVEPFTPRATCWRPPMDTLSVAPNLVALCQAEQPPAGHSCKTRWLTGPSNGPGRATNNEEGS
jgi:hypothetical protein